MITNTDRNRQIKMYLLIQKYHSSDKDYALYHFISAINSSFVKYLPIITVFKYSVFRRKMGM